MMIMIIIVIIIIEYLNKTRAQVQFLAKLS